MHFSITHVLYCTSLIITCPAVSSNIVPPREAIIMDEFGQRLHGVVGPYNEGYPMSLVCESEGGDPPPDVTWWKNEVLIDDTYTLTPQHFTRNVLHFPRVHREDLMMVLICQASNSNLTNPVTSSVTLDLNLRPLDVKIHTPFKPAYVGQELHIECQSQGARPPAQITWWKGNEKQPQVKEIVVREDNLTISTLTYIPVVSDNGKNLSCRADNPQLRDSEIEDIWYLDVYYAPVLSLSKNVNDTAGEHSSVILTCQVQANPPITHISWRLNGEDLVNSPFTGIVINNQSLHLTSVEKQHQGYYHCEGANSEGKGKSEETLLTVHYSPKCASPNHSIYGMIKIETRVTCDVDANPTNVTFKWALKNVSQEVQALKVKTFESNRTRSIASFLPGSFVGYDTILCWASNAVGVQKEACIFRIMTPGPPESPKQCIISNRTAECLIVQCISGNNGGLTQVFHLEIFNTEEDGLEANLTHSDIPAFNVCNLPSETSFILVIYSANDKGRSKSVVLQSSTISSTRRTQQEETLSTNQIVGIIIGAISVLLLLFSAIIIGKIQFQRRRNGIPTLQIDVAGRTRRRDLEKSQTHLMNEFKPTKGPGSQGPDIIPEHNYFQGMPEKPSVLRINDSDAGQRTTKGEPPPKKYEKYQAVKCGIDEDMILSEYLQTPSKLRMGSDATEGDIEDSCMTVETPLINDIQLNITQWEDSYKRLGVLSTPV